MTNTPGVPDHAAPAPPWIARARKFLVSVVGLVAMLVASGALHGTAQNVAQAVIAVATALGVYAAPNAQPRGGKTA